MSQNIDHTYHINNILVNQKVLKQLGTAVMLFPPLSEINLTADSNTKSQDTLAWKSN